MGLSVSLQWSSHLKGILGTHAEAQKSDSLPLFPSPHTFSLKQLPRAGFSPQGKKYQSSDTAKVKKSPSMLTVSSKIKFPKSIHFQSSHVQVYLTLKTAASYMWKLE